MNQHNKLALDKRRQIGALVQIAPVTRKAQFGFVVRPTVLPGDDVFNVKVEQRLIFLSESTIFTPIVGTLSDDSSSGRIDSHFNSTD